MKKFRVRDALVPAGLLSLATVLQAHPGHDGHELTWDFSHLTAYPVATTTCFALLAGAGYAAWLLLRRATTQRIQSLRRSDARRGK